MRAGFRLRTSCCGIIMACFVLAACSAQGDKPGFIVLPGMFTPVPYEAQDQHPLFGSVLRAPPQGAVPYGATPYTYTASPADKARAGLELTNPFTGEAELARGKQVFETFCAVCHGFAGLGDGPIIGRFPNPPSLMAPHAKELPDGQIFHVITHGQGLMASYAGQVRAADRWRVVNYIRSIQER